MSRVLVVHAVWSRDARLRLWAEGSALPARAGARRGRPAASPAPRLHPFACGAAALGGALERLGVPLPSCADVKSALTLRLPSSSFGPQGSPQLLRPVEDELAFGPFDGFDIWDVPVLDIPASSALDLALALPPGPVAGVVVGDSLRALAEAAKLALELVARGRLRAALVRRGDAWVARWRAVTEDAQDAARVELLERSLPAVVSASPDAPQAVARDILDAVVDACARELRSADADDPQPESAVDAWLAALAREDPVVCGDPWELAALAEQLDEWWDAGQRYAAQRMFRTCFRLVAPDEPHDGGDEAAAGGDDTGAEPPWRVEILLQSKEDPSVLVPAAEVWSHGEHLTALGRMLENPQERLLGGLGHALALWPDLAPALREAAPTEVLLDADAAHRFLRDAAPALEQGGFAVFAPRWWSERLRVKLRVEPTAEWQDSSGLLGIDGLCSYEWRVAIGDATLSPSDLRELAALKAPLVRARGRWIALRPEDVEAALRFFEGRRRKGRAQAGELLRTGLGLDGHGAPAGSPAVEIEAAGWLGELLAADGNRRLEAIPTPAAFAGELRPYQQRGLAWLAFMSSVGLGGCLADDMGLGKTIQLLALLLAEREAPADGANGARAPRRRRVGPTLLICPMSVAGNWQREAQRFAPSLRVHVHHGRERITGRAFARTARASDIVFTTYALALRDRETLGAVKWERLVLDEAQNIKSIETKQTRAIRGLQARHRVALTGTPVENRLSELHSIMDFLNPGLLGSAAGFRERYANPIERYRDVEATQRLREATGPFVLRRLKTDKDIITDLPEKIEMRTDCHLTREQATLYQAVVDDMLERAAAAVGFERAGIILAALTKLKQVCNHPAHLLKDRSRLEGRSGKLTRLEEIVDEALAEGDRVLCFTQFAELGHELRAHMQERLGREVLFLHGGTPKAARDAMVARFQGEDGPALFVLSLKAGGTGLNLTAANHVIHFDRWWNPAVEDQATDRAFRIGQHKNVQVRKLTCVGTLEERIDRLIAEKKELADRIVGSGEAGLTELDTAQLRELVALSTDAVAV
jgi:non-specific serine/threonine protein kinase